MNLHEYQAKDVFRSYGIPVPAGQVAGSPEEAAEAARALGGTIWVVKAQVHAGGRGKGTFKEHPQQRGVVLVKSADEARDKIKALGWSVEDTKEGMKYRKL